MTLEQHGNSVRVVPPSGRSYYAFVGAVHVQTCTSCRGEGHWDSCFDCGNHGYTFDHPTPPNSKETL